MEIQMRKDIAYFAKQMRESVCFTKEEVADYLGMDIRDVEKVERYKKIDAFDYDAFEVGLRKLVKETMVDGGSELRRMCEGREKFWGEKEVETLMYWIREGRNSVYISTMMGVMEEEVIRKAKELGHFVERMEWSDEEMMGV